MSNKEVWKEGIHWTNEDGTAGYQPFTDDNFEDCQHCGRPHGDEVEIVQGKDRAIVYLHPECEAPYRQRWGDKIIIISALANPSRSKMVSPSNRTQETEPTGPSADCEEENDI